MFSTGLGFGGVGGSGLNSSRRSNTGGRGVGTMLVAARALRSHVLQRPVAPLKTEVHSVKEARLLPKCSGRIILDGEPAAWLVQCSAVRCLEASRVDRLDTHDQLGF